MDKQQGSKTPYPLPSGASYEDLFSAKFSPLYEIHNAFDARIVNYMGWIVPLYYMDPRKEHLAVRLSAGIMDMCFNIIFEVRGDDRENMLSSLIPFDIKDIKPGMGRTALFLEESGTIVACAELWRLEERLLLTTSPACSEWISEKFNELSGSEFSFKELTPRSTCITVTGRKCKVALQNIVDYEISRIPENGIVEALIGGHDALIARNSATGELAFDCLIKSSAAVEIWEKLIAAAEGKLHPVGIGTIESLRIQGGVHRFETELAGGVTPIEAGLVSEIDQDSDFPGKEAFLEEVDKGPKRTFAGVLLDTPPVPRPGDSIFHDSNKVGFLTSTTLMPTSGKPIALAQVRPEFSAPGTSVAVLNENEFQAGKIVNLPFLYQQNS